jgi:hypothetical protein
VFSRGSPAYKFAEASAGRSAASQDAKDAAMAVRDIRIKAPVDLDVPIDIGDPVEIDRVVNRCTRPVLREAALLEDLMPPGRLEWFGGFIRRCLEGAILQGPRKYLNHYWESFARELLVRGVLVTILESLQLEHDPTAKDERRGWAFAGNFVTTRFLRDRKDIRDVLESAIRVKQPEIWLRYSVWYAQYDSLIGSPSGYVAAQREDAVRFLPMFEAQDALLDEMLGDEVRSIRHIAALRLADAMPAASDEKLLSCLLDAAADESWVWSRRDHYENGRLGCHEAFLMLERFGVRAGAAAPLLKSQITRVRASPDRGWDEWLAKADGLLDVFEGRQQPPEVTGLSRIG